MPRYSFDSESAEREPLETQYSYSPQSRQPYRQQQQQQQQQHYQQYQDSPDYRYHQNDNNNNNNGQAQYQQQQQQQNYGSPTRSDRPGAHPDSHFGRLRQERRLSRDRSASGGPSYLATGAAAGAAATSAQYSDAVSPISPPQPPPHRDADGRYWGQELGYGTGPQSNITPGADNFGEAAAGGLSGVAYSVADRHPRESGVEAMSGPNYPQQAYQSQQQQQYGRGAGNGPYGNDQASQGLHPAAYAAGYTGDRNSHSSLAGLNAAAVPPGAASPGMRTPSRSPHRAYNDLYSDDPYQGYSGMPNPSLGVVNPHDIEDDGDEGLEYGRRGHRTSMLSLGGSSNRSGHHGTAAAAAGAGAGGAAAGAGVMGALGGLVGRNAAGRSGGPSGQYDPVHNGSTGYQGGGSAYDLGSNRAEKSSDWLSKQSGSSKKWKWVIIIGIGLVIAAGIACGIVFGVVLKNKNGSSSSSGSASDDEDANGDLNINSSEIKKLLNNADLHKIFPGVDYTPLNTQYPDCLHSPPSQNNVTRDVAVLSQLTNTIRLYGTDCNQTEMVIHALKQLKMDDTIKIWMGVWQDNNDTTNARQLEQMWTILDTYGETPFKGLIVANEILFREQMTTSELGTLLASVRTNLTSKDMSLPVATSDLGDKWTAELAQQSDYVMANIHPFFGGINAKDAASWTYSFWENNNGPYFKSDADKNIISETGWPTQGGTDCGTDTVTDCPDASVAGIDELNQFMEDWVCDALTNGTQYFWFEAFDEPWKIQFNEEGKEWEDHWGLLDVNRKLKSGVKIPDCGGKTV